MEVADTFDYVCPLIARSTQITDLKIVTELDGQLKESNVLDLVVWFSSQPVRMFSLGGYHEWDDIDIAVRQKYYEAMVNCSTLDELVLDASGTNDLDFSKFTFSMRSLEIHCPNHFFFESMAGRLEASKVADLKIFASFVKEISIFKSLLEVLPKTSIKSLRWDDVILDQKHWCELVPLLAKCPLEGLTLNFKKLHTEIAHSIAMALETNEFICELDLSGSFVAMEDFETLIKSMTHPSRPVATKRIIWMRKYRKTAHAEPLAQLKQLAEDRGGEFIF
ncbi:hypothetical protein AeNC1_010581 [Aphanomyces euteiches]|nr:hypothetical protein AeNC1_010581 [Aphanomyces euteiches]